MEFTVGEMEEKELESPPEEKTLLENSERISYSVTSDVSAAEGTVKLHLMEIHRKLFFMLFK